MRDAVQPLKQHPCNCTARPYLYRYQQAKTHQPGVIPQPAQEGGCIHEPETPQKYHTRQPVFPTEDIGGILSSCFRHDAQGWLLLAGSDEGPPGEVTFFAHTARKYKKRRLGRSP